MSEKKPAGEVKVYFTQELFNSVISVLSDYVKADEHNQLSQYALKLKKKIMNYGREFIQDNEINIAVCFYPEEAALLIKLFTIYNNAIEEPSENFFEIFHKNKMENIKI